MRILLLILVFPLFVLPAGAQMQRNSDVQSYEFLPYQPPLAYEESSSGLEPPSLDGGPIGVEIGDVNNDGFVDLVSIGDHGSPYINTTQHGIMVWFGNGTGAGWSNYMNGNFGYGDVALGDLNNDGFMDVGYGLHHDYGSNDFGDQLIETVLGDGTGMNWTPWDDGLAEHGQTYGMFGTDFADVDADGDLDLVSISFGYGQGMHVYLNNTDGTWTRSFGFLGSNTSSEVLFGDVNADGNPDIAAGLQAGAVWLGDGVGGFVNADANLPNPGGYGFYNGPDLGDVNQDGYQDLSFCLQNGSVQVWTWNRFGNWSDLTQGLPTAGYDRTRLWDMNNDGRLDLVASGNGRVTVWRLGQGAIWKEVVTFIATSSNPGDTELLQVQDVDYNGRADIVVIIREGNWPNDRNKMRFFRETLEPKLPRVRLTHPLGNESFIRGAVVFLDWNSAVPAGGGGASRITLELSLNGPAGPFSEIATDLPNSGRYQWRIPTGLSPSSDCRLRIVLTTPSGSHQYTMARSFDLL